MVAYTLHTCTLSTTAQGVVVPLLLQQRCLIFLTPNSTSNYRYVT
jgi:hypothetical protein